MANDSYKFGLNDVKIATWTDASNWGTAVDVPAVQMLGIQVQTVNGILEGDDVITDTHAKIIGGQIRFRFGFQNLSVWAILTGLTEESSDTDYAMTFTGGQNMPYIGVVGRVDDTAGGGNDILFAPKVKLMEPPELRMEYGQYVIPEMTLQMVPNTGGSYGVFRILQHDAATTATIPPTAIPT